MIDLSMKNPPAIADEGQELPTGDGGNCDQ